MARIPRLIVLCLLAIFGITAMYAIHNLRLAFKSAYQNEAFDSLTKQAAGTAPSKIGGQFHSKYFSPQVVRWQSSIMQWSGEFDLPPDLISIVMQIESCGHPEARSGAGAMGIFQVMPFHFTADEDPYDPSVNANRGLAYLARGYASSSGDIERTLAGYNGGHSLIDSPSGAWPQETQRYVSWGLGLWEDIRTENYPSPTLERWMEAGGSHLCSAASATALQASRSD